MAENVDMFSLLPESLLPIIISFLPFKEAARTSVLSKQWVHVWKSTRNIEFNELLFVKPGESQEINEAQKRIFLDFMTHWISHYRVNTVDGFSLTVSSPQNYTNIIETCVAFATQRGVKHLKLDFSDPKWEEEINNDNLESHVPLFELPNHVYEHESLETLKLYSCRFSMPGLFNLKALKDVSFGWVEVRNETLRVLLSTCKKIENLTLKRCWNIETFDLGNNEVGLRKLVIDKCQFHFNFFNFKAPMLWFFKFSGKVGSFCIEEFRNLMEADIDFSDESEFYEGYEMQNLLADLCCVKSLTVCSYLLQTVPSGEELVKMSFDLNVRHLILKTEMHPYELCGVMFLLNSCPMLEKLTIEFGPQKIHPDYTPPNDGVDLKKFWQQYMLVPICLRRSLKVVEVRGYRASNKCRLACYYLIAKGRVLENFNINVLKDGNNELVEKRRENAQLLLTIPRASQNLHISIE